MSFGKRTLVTYKARLEKILTEIVLITEIAELAQELETLESTMHQKRVNPVLRSNNKWRNTMDINYQGSRGTQSPSIGEDGQLIDSWDDSNDDEHVSVDEDDEVDDDDDDAEEDDDDDDESGDYKEDEKEGVLRDEVQETNAENLESEPKADPSNGGATVKKVRATSPDSTSTENITGTIYSGWSQGSSKIKRLLDRWEDPENKLGKTVDASIADILKFRKALTYMDDSNPVGSPFDPAATKDECIRFSTNNLPSAVAKHQPIYFRFWGAQNPCNLEKR